MDTPGIRTSLLYTRWPICAVCINYMCVIWNTDVGRASKHSTLLSVSSRSFCKRGLSSRSFCKRGHNGLFKILGGGGHLVVWACEAQITRRAHSIQEGANAPPCPPSMKPCYLWCLHGGRLLANLMHTLTLQRTLTICTCGFTAF